MGQYLYSRAKLIGTGYIQGKLYDLGQYPGLIHSPDAVDKVSGEIYELCDTKPILSRIDEYEGCSHKDPKPHLYRRESVLVNLQSEQSIMAWTYFYQGNYRVYKYIRSGDYVSYIKTSAQYSRFI